MGQPLQYQKQLRLQEARQLLLAGVHTASDVAFAVGYESASQFSREYVRQFGAPPAHIIIDTDADEALWFSSAGNQVVRLGAPLERPVPKLQALPDWLKAADRLRAQAPG